MINLKRFGIQLGIAAVVLYAIAIVQLQVRVNKLEAQNTHLANIVSQVKQAQIDAIRLQQPQEPHVAPHVHAE